jgi:dynein heavy chain, axonemal
LWSYLEPLFIGSEEVKKELPNDAKRFEKVNASVMSILSEAVSTGNICDSCNKEGLSASLDTVATDLDLCKKSLKEFLDGKRAIFPRFYFVSEAQLLDLLSNGSTPHKIIKYTTAVFLACKTLVLDPPTYDPNSTARPKCLRFISCVGVEQNDMVSKYKSEGAAREWSTVVIVIVIFIR